MKMARSLFILLLPGLFFGPVSLASENDIACCPAGIRSGDLVFRMGRGWISDLIRTWSGPGAKYSHVGVVTAEAGIAYVVHVEPDFGGSGVNRVRKERMKTFLHKDKARDYGVYRVSALDAEAVRAVTKRLDRYVRNQTPYDDLFDLDRDDRLYCTELVYRAFLAAGIDLLVEAAASRGRLPSIRGRRVFLPTDLLQSVKLILLQTAKR